MVESNPEQAVKPGRKTGYRKANTMTGRLALRVPQELVDWLEEQGLPKGLGVGDMARMFLMEKMNRAKRKD